MQYASRNGIPNGRNCFFTSLDHRMLRSVKSLTCWYFCCRRCYFLTHTDIGGYTADREEDDDEDEDDEKIAGLGDI